MSKYKSILRVGISSLLTFAFVALFMASSAYAAARTVSGKIKTSSNANANGASVTVFCGSNQLNTTSASNGNFEVIFADGDCNEGDTVTVNASFNGESATENQVIGPGAGNISFNTINLAAVAVPEFGLITGLVAAGGSALAYMKMRKGMA